MAQIESGKAQLFVEILIGIARECLSRRNLVLTTQPPTEPFQGMLSYDPVRFTDGTLAEIVRPPNHDTVKLSYLLFRISPAHSSVGDFADPMAYGLDLPLGRTFAHISVARLRRVAPTKGVTQKVERFVGDPTKVRLLLIYRQLQLPKDAAHRVHRLIGISAMDAMRCIVVRSVLPGRCGPVIRVESRGGAVA